MEWLNFRHLYSFWAVCRHGGFQKAADRLHVSQSTISSQVAQLEAYLDEQLIERSTRSVNVTDRGTALLEYADSIFARSAEINHIFRDKMESLVPTRIRIGMVGGISRNFIFGLLVQSLVEERGTEIDVVDGSLDDLTGLLKRFELDLVLSTEKPRSRDLVSLAHRRIESSSMILAGKPELVRRVKRRHATPLPMELYVFRHPFEGDPIEQTVASTFNLDAVVPVRTDDISLLRFLANGGRGLALLPGIGVQEDLAAGLLSRIRIDNAPRVDFYATFLERSLHRELVDDFLGLGGSTHR